MKLSRIIAVLVSLCLAQAASAQDKPAPSVPSSAPDEAAPTGPEPFGASLFRGHFMAQRQDGVNPEYAVMPGDRVAVSTWGAVQISDVLVVDGQGNIFLPGIGPVPLAGVRNADLTQVVKARIGRVYRANFEVYTNLLSAAPVGVFVTGGVERPGRYAGVPSDSVLFFLDQAGGIDPDLGSYRSIRVLRSGQLLAEIDLYAFLLEGELPTVQFAEGDTVVVQRRGPVVELRGAAGQPSLVELGTGKATGADVVAVVPNRGRVNEVTITGLRQRAPFNQTVTLDEFGTVSVRDGDVITFREDGRSATILVRLEGEFEGPSVLSVRRGARLLDVLNHVAVQSDIADTAAVHLRRDSVAKAQKKAIEDSLLRLERSALLALSRSQGESNIRAKEAELTRGFVERARLIQPVGRVVTSRAGEQQNLMLEDGDVLVIPTRTTVVRVSGEVQLTQAVTYAKGLTAGDYIASAGGFTDRADDDAVIVMHASAEVTVGDLDTPVLPGDEVLVPPRVDRKRLQNAADIINVIYQVAVSAGVVLAATPLGN